MPLPRSPLPALVLAGGLLLACAGEQPASRSPVLLLAVDGMEWNVLLPLLAAGELPTLAEWIEGGQAGLLESMRPTKSPVVWTTVATGRRPREHGILDFVKPGDGEPELYTSADRTSAALWNMTSREGLRAAVIGWWMTYPVEPIEGLMVAQTNTLPGEGGGGGLWKGAPQQDLPDQVYPADRGFLVRETLGPADAGLDELLTAVFGELPRPLPRHLRNLWQASRWAFRADHVYLSIAQRVLAQGDEGFDLAMLYLGGTDVVGHRFWRYFEPAAYDHPPTVDEVRDYGSVIPDYYRYVDRALGDLWRGLDGDWNVLVVSDHGMRPHRTEATYDPETEIGRMTSGHHLDAPPGVVVAFGPDIRRVALPRPLAELRREQLPTLGSVLDVAPTVLTLLELPVARDMSGRPLEGLFTRERAARRRPAPIDTYDAAREAAPSPGQASEEADRERIEQLKALGYIDDGS